MNEKNKQLIKELALDLVSGDLVALAVDIGNAAVDFAKLNERVRKWWEVQPDKKVSALLKDISATLVDMILDGTGRNDICVVDETVNYLESELEKKEIPEDVRKMIVDNFELYILEYIRESNALLCNDIAFWTWKDAAETRIAALEARINLPGKEEESPFENRMDRFQIDSIDNSDIQKRDLRVKEIEGIKKHFASYDSNVLILYGAPGIGKTTLAKLYANSLSGYKKYFVRYQNSFKETLNSMCKKKEENSWKIAISYWKNLKPSERQKVLLIIDNYNEDISRKKNAVLQSVADEDVFLQLKETGIKIIITTRIHIGGNGIEVQGVGESLLLFEAYYGKKIVDEEKGEIQQLIKTVHNNTLILALCAYIWREKKNRARLLERMLACHIKEDKLELFKEADYLSGQLKEYPTLYGQVKAILDISGIQKSKECRYMVANAVLLPLSGMEKDQFLEFLGSEADADINILNMLINHSWIIDEQVNGRDVLSIHPVIREILLDNNMADFEKSREYCRAICEQLDLDISMQKRIKYKSHAEQIYQLFSDKKDVVLVRLFYRLSDIYDFLHESHQSRKMTDTVLDQIELIEDQREKSRIYSGIAYSYNNDAHTLQELDQALSFLDIAESILTVIRGKAGGCSEQAYLEDLGRIYSNRGSNSLARAKKEKLEKHYENALIFHQKALNYRKMAEKLVSNETEKSRLKKDMAASYTGLATTQFYLNNYKESLNYHEKALEIRETIDSPRCQINQERYLGGVLKWYQTGGNPEAHYLERAVSFSSELLNANKEHGELKAFHTNLKRFSDLIDIIRKDNRYRSLKETAEQAYISVFGRTK